MEKNLDEFKKEILNIGTIKKIPDSDPDMNDDYLLLSLLSNLKYFPPYSQYISTTFKTLLDEKFKFQENIFSQKPFNFDIDQKFNELNKKINQINQNKKLNKTKKEIKAEKLKDNSKSAKGSSSELFGNSEKTNSNSLIDQQNKSKENNIMENKVIDTLNNELSKNEKKNEISYLVDTFNLNGKKYVRLISEILICLCNDFQFRYDISPNMKIINNIFSECNLSLIQDIQFDFLTLNLSPNSFYSFIEYLSSNIFYFQYNNNKYIKKDDNIQFNLKKYFDISSFNNNIDLIGEVGSFILSEDKKLQQIQKYSSLLNNLKSINDENKLKIIYDQLNLIKENTKFLLFVCDGSFTKFFNHLNDYQNKFLKEIEKSKSNFILMFFSGGEEENKKREKFLINYINDKEKIKKTEGNKILQKIMANNEEYFNNLSFKKLSFKFDEIIRKLKNIEKEYMSYIKNNNFFQQSNEFSNIINYDIAIDVDIDKFLNLPNLNKYNNEENQQKKIENNKINIILVSPLKFDDLFLKQFGNNCNIYCFKFLNDDNSQILFGRNKIIYDKLMKEFHNKKLNIFILILDNKENLIFLEYLADLLQINHLQYLIVYKRNDNIADEQCSSLRFNSNHILVIKSLDNIQDLIKKINQQFTNNSLKLMEYEYKINTLFKLYNTEYYFKIINKEINNNNELLFIQKIKEDIGFFSNLSYNNIFQLDKTITDKLLLCFQNSKIFISNFLDNNKVFKEFEQFFFELLNVNSSNDILPTQLIISSLKEKLLQCLNIINIKYFYNLFLGLLRKKIGAKVLNSKIEELVNNDEKISI